MKYKAMPITLDTRILELQINPKPFWVALFFGLQAFDCLGIAVLIANKALLMIYGQSVLFYFSSESGFLFFLGFTWAVLTCLFMKTRLR